MLWRKKQINLDERTQAVTDTVVRVQRQVDQAKDWRYAVSIIAIVKTHGLVELVGGHRHRKCHFDFSWEVVMDDS
jgi:hypothetical protein